MDIESRLTVYFEDPFWVGVFESSHDGKLSAAKITFGAEPKDYEVYDGVLRYWNRLCFSPTVSEECSTAALVSPKRMQRNINKCLSEKGVGTKAQQALKLQHEQSVQARKAQNREKNETLKQFQFELRQQKRKEKHRGR